MSLLAARDLGAHVATRTLFEGVTLQLEDGDRLGLIGPNGAGKSTLLRMLAGLAPPDEGAVVAPRGLRVAYVPQDKSFDPALPPRAVVTAALEARAAGHGSAGRSDDRLDPATRAAIALSRLGFDDLPDPELPAGRLSGGWRKRLALAIAVADEPDVLLLDEPTNHLDTEAVEWLETFVPDAARVVVFVTHDRRFLDRVATRIVELSAAYPGGTYEVRGGYTEFVRRKEAFLEAEASERSRLANAIRRDTAWLRQGIQGRQTRNKTQVEQASDRRAEMQRMKDRVEAGTRTAGLDFTASERRTRKLLALEGVTVERGGRRLLSDLELVLSPGRRVGLVGPNGAGKSSLLAVMEGTLEPAAGTVRRADDLRLVVFSQHRGELDPEATLHESLCPVGDVVETPTGSVHVSGWAKRFLFRPDQLRTRIADLSGGEQARVVVARLMLAPADVLLLDEPTNDLDIPSLEALEGALLEFPGAIVLVSHDRFLMERVSTSILALDGTGTTREHASYALWEAAEATRRETAEARAREAAAAAKAAPARGDAAPAGPARKLSYKLQRELDGMEEAVLEAETALEEAQAAAADPGLATDHERATKAYERLAEAQQRVDALYARWQELESMRAPAGS